MKKILRFFTMAISIFLLLFLLSSSQVQSTELSPINGYKVTLNHTLQTTPIEIHNGKIRGKILKNKAYDSFYSAFKGIRYGVIPQRFMPSVDVESWEGLQNAFDHGEKCLQYNGKMLVGSEHCLFLNVYTPVMNFNFTDKTNPKKAVMVWIHGGMFRKGSGNSEQFGPDFIVEKDVVLVTLNYRLATLGFLNLQHPKAPGNIGIKDQNLALKWVKKNIAKFGGDPDNITIFGQSAGGVSVDLHAMSKMSKGLFKRSMAFSGSVFCPWAFSTQPIEKAIRFAKTFTKVKNESVDALLDLYLTAPGYKLVTSHDSNAVYHRELEFNPSIENPETSKQDALIDSCFNEPIRQGFYVGDHILGYTSQEVRFNEYARFAGNERLNTLSEAQFNKPIDLKQRYLKHYINSTVYYYRFGFLKNKKAGGLGHSQDMIYVFYKEEKYKDFTDDDKAMERLYTTLLTNYAKYGKPFLHSKSGVFEWTPSDKNGNFLNIDAFGNLMMVNDRPVRFSRKDEDYLNRENLCINYKPSFSTLLSQVLFGKSFF